jgi:uncharacterized protein (DUF488 family)
VIFERGSWDKKSKIAGNHMFSEKTIFTLGTSNRTLEEFVNLLRSYAIERVADVRSFPTSQFPHFKKEALEQTLREEGFSYSYLGKELGGYRKGGYRAYMQTEGYIRGLGLLESLASRCHCAFFCAERLPWRCHRRFIGQGMQKRGWKVVHIIDEDRIWEDKSSYQYLNLPSEKAE